MNSEVQQREKGSSWESIGANKSINFAPATSNDAHLICHNHNKDYEFLHSSDLFSIDETRKWLENMPRTSKRLMVTIRDNETRLEPTIGIIRIDNIDFTNRTCYVGADIFERYRGNGYSKPLYSWLFNYLFNSYNMEVVYLDVLATNTRAIQLYEKLGFKRCGCLPGKLVRNRKRIDSFVYYLDYEQWQKLYLSPESAVS